MGFILLWWLPVWLLSPTISTLLGYSPNSPASHRVFVALIVIQTVFGIAGVVIAGREVVTILKGTQRKKVPGKIWHIFWSGSASIQDGPKSDAPSQVDL